MIKKILIILLMLILCGCSSNSTKNDYLKNIKVEDFELIISVDKDCYMLGEEMTIKVELKNVSGKTMKMEVGHVDYKTIEDCIMIKYSINDENPSFFMNDLGGTRKKITFLKDETITKERKITVKHNKYTIQACIYFYVGEDFDEKIFKLSNQIIIDI